MRIHYQGSLEVVILLQASSEQYEKQQEEAQRAMPPPSCTRKSRQKRRAKSALSADTTVAKRRSPLRCRRMRRGQRQSLFLTSRRKSMFAVVALALKCKVEEGGDRRMRGRVRLR
jgi:hypothetical protein